MSIKRIMMVARYEAKLLRRSWVFLIFAILGVAGVACFQFLIGDIDVTEKYSWSAGPYLWYLRALPSCTPYMNAYLFNFLQALLIVFFVVELEKRSRLTTMEPLWTRPSTNGELMWGRALGIGGMIILLNIISVLVTMMLHLLIRPWAFDASMYLFYFLTLTIPSLVFFLGVSMFVSYWIRSQGIAVLMLLALIVIMIGSEGWLHGLMDPLAKTIPAVFSPEVGLVNMNLFLLQRLVFLSSGAALLVYSVFCAERLTGEAEKKNVLFLIGTMGLGIAIFAGVSYEGYFIRGTKQREMYRQAYIRYDDKKEVHVLEHDISFKERMGSMEASSQMKICNNTGRELLSIVMYLNPSLMITRLTCEGKEVQYKRDEQVIEISRTIQPDDTLNIMMEYEGCIDERVCYLDLSDKEYYDTKANSVSIYRFGNKQAFVGEKVTLLQPECLWYPQSVAPVNLSSLYDRQVDFTRYSLTVDHAIGRSAVSQGIPERTDGQTLFRHKHALQGISLSIAEYENRSIEVDGTRYDIFFFKESAPLLQAFAAPENVIKTVIRDIKFMTESSYCQMDAEYKKKAQEVWRKKGEIDGENPEIYSPLGRYPYEWFIMTETPVSYARFPRGWALGDEYLQAGMVLLKERMANFPFLKIGQPHGEEWDAVATNNLIQDYRMIFRSELCDIAPLFSGNTFFMTSEEFPAIHEVIRILGVPIDFSSTALQAPERVSDVMNYLQNHSLEQAFTDKHISPKLLKEVIEWKTYELRERLKYEQSEEKFVHFYKQFLEKHLFETIDINLFCEEYGKEFGMDLKERLGIWYKSDHLPVLLLGDFVLTELPEEDNESRRTKPSFARFKVYNPGDLESVLVAHGAKIKGEKTSRFLIRGHECKEIRVKMDYPGLMITYPLAQNLPMGRWVLSDEMRPFDGDTLTGVFTADSSIFQPRPGEIIVDNQDPGFKLIEPQGEKLFHMLRGGTKSWEPVKSNFERWTQMVDNRFYGKIVHDAYCKGVGTGKYKAEWTAQIPEEGTYEVFFCNGEFFKMGLSLQARKKGGVRYYTVYGREKGTEVQVEPAEVPIGWVSLGKYHFEKGEAKVVLDDRGETIKEGEKTSVTVNEMVITGMYKQAIVADAVKWVKRGR